MSLQMGASAVSKLYLGSSAVSKLYRGPDLVWQAGAAAPPITDDFSGAFDTAKWAGTSYGVSNVSGRLRIPTDTSFPQAETTAVFDLTQYPVWVEMPTVPVPGNGGTETRFFLSSGSNLATFFLQGAPLTWAFQLTGQSSTFLTYNATNHRWLRFRIDAGNLLFETSPDKVTWTVARTIAAPSWLTSGLAKVTLSSDYFGTETAPGFAEFDNFNL